METMLQMDPTAPTRKLLLGALALLPIITTACAPSMPPVESGPPTGYDLLEDGASPAAFFEIAPSDLDPAEVVPLDLLQGPHHVIRSVRLDHRFLYTYVVDTAYGELEVTGRGLLRKRVMEMEALAEFDERNLGKTRLYAYEVANAASDPVELTLQILRHPVRTVANLPKSAVGSYKAMREMRERGRTHVEDNYAAEFIGLGGLKREWALRMGVDPYTTNPHVRARLARNGWLSLAGGLTVTLATIPVPARGATIALSVVGATSGIEGQLQDVAPEDVRVRTRSWLRDEIGVEGELADSFLAHPWYSPSRQETIIRALTRMEGARHRERFIEMAVRADEPHEAYAFTRLALMFAESHARRSAIHEIFTAHGLLMAHTADGGVVLPLYMDHGYWTQEVAEAVAEIAHVLGRDPEIGGKLVIVSGRVSPRAGQELMRRGWEIADALDELWLAEIDFAQYRPRARNANRILPELGY